MFLKPKASFPWDQDPLREGVFTMIAIDQCHCDLIYGLIVSSKPRDILELGFGHGASASAIQRGILFNGIQANHTIVDNWHDWNGKRPDDALNVMPWIHAHIVEKDESEFLCHCEDTYDFILSDGDHHHADQTFEDAWRCLKKHGILIYHDVTNRMFPNLFDLRGHAEEKNAPNILFAKSTRPDEECERGLLVIFK